MAFASINCYQESANISNQSGTDNPCNQIYNGSYASTVNATGRYDPNGQNFMDVNYTKPVGATNNSIWQVEHGEASVATLNPITPRPPYNITIPSACWNAYPNLLRLRFTSYTGGDDAAGKVASWPSCWNGTDFTFVGNNYSTNQVILLQNEVFIPTFWRDGNWSTFSSRLAFNNDWQDGAQPGVLFSKEGDAEVFEEAMWWTIGMSITLNAPADSASLTSATTTLNFTAIDPSVSSFACSLNQDGSITQTNSSVSNNTLTTFTVIGLTDGTHTWKINCSDGVISGNSLTRNFTVDTTAPIISLNSPANNYYQFNNQSVLFNFTATDNIATTLNCSLYLDAVLNTTNASTQNGTATTFNVNGISYATHNWSVSCLDSASNTGTSATNNFTLVNIYFITATLANNSNTTANPIQLNLTATSNQTSNCVFGINGINSTGTVIGTYCFLNFTNLTHNTTYNITGYANFSGNIGATNETRVINWYNQSLCTLLDNIYNLTQNQSIRSTVGDSQMAVIATISLNNTCPVNIVNLNYKLNDGVANGTASTYLINITANSQANFSNYGYYIPISFTESSQGSVPIGAYGNNELYILNTTYGRNISSIIISVGSLGNPVSLYDCEVAPCSLSNNSAWSLLSPSISGSSLFGSAGYLSSTLSFLQSYQVSGGGGGGGGGGFVIPTNQTPPAAAPENVTGQQTIAPDIQDNAKCLALGAGLLVLLFIFNRGKKQ